MNISIKRVWDSDDTGSSHPILDLQFSIWYNKKKEGALNYGYTCGSCTINLTYC